jgi:hypothetical protein
LLQVQLHKKRTSMGKSTIRNDFITNLPEKIRIQFLNLDKLRHLFILVT